MSTRQIETFQKKHIKEVVRFLNETMPYDQITEELLKEQTSGDLDYEPALSLIAREKRIEGFVLGICRREESYSGMKIFSVREGANGQAIGIALLEKLEQEFIKRGIFHISAGRCPIKYLQPGMDARYTMAVSLLLKKGYQIEGTGQNMEVDLATSEFDTRKEEEKLKQAGIIVKRLQEDDRSEYMHSLKDFGSTFFYSGMLAYNNDPVSAHIAVQDNKVVGYAVHSVTTGHYFGPEGVSPKMQGKGIGEVLLKRCLKDIKETGEKKAVIFSVGPVYFYWKTVGAVIPRLLWKMSKDLKKK